MKAIELEINIAAPRQTVFEAWSNAGDVSKWFAPAANVDPKTDGAFEVFFDPSNHDSMSTKGCTFKSYDPVEALIFTWKGPDDMAELMNHEPLTIVAVDFFEEGSATRVRLEHSGFGEGKAWDNAMKWHEIAWQKVLDSLKAYAEANRSSGGCCGGCGCSGCGGADGCSGGC